jgi:hypothetical protein
MTIATVSFGELVLGALCVWRVTHLLNAEDGPGRILVRLRRRSSESWVGQLLGCFYCLSLWVAALAAWLIGSGWKDYLLLLLGLSGAACLLERATREPKPSAGFVPEESQEETQPEDESAAITTYKFRMNFAGLALPPQTALVRRGRRARTTH